jgi:NAD(P)-dependent dehydrogenase (short-subunit alcohol dehydrogenase family)
MIGRLEGKTCIVTAAAQGIGRAIAEAFLREGASVTAIDLQLEQLEGLGPADRVRKVQADVTDAQAVQALARANDGVQVLVNCVGLVETGALLDCPPGALERSFRINVVSMYNTITAFLPDMRARRDGAIVNIASVVSSVKAAPDRFAYATTKAAVIGLTKSVARDYGGDGVRCNAISPGTVLSPSLQGRLRATGDYETALAAFVARQPMGRLGAAAEIAEVAVMAVSDEARFMTGANIIVDGGMSL